MAIKLRHNGVNVVTEWHETLSSYNAADEYSVRFMGRGLWHVVRENDGYKWTMSTSKLQRFFHRYVLESLYDGPYEGVFYTVEYDK